MQRQTVESSQIHSVGYDAAAKLLEIQFKQRGEPGGVYQYTDVPPEEHAALIGAESIGKHFGASIRGKFDFKRLPDDKPEA